MLPDGERVSQSDCTYSPIHTYMQKLVQSRLVEDLEVGQAAVGAASIFDPLLQRVVLARRLDEKVKVGEIARNGLANDRQQLAARHRAVIPLPHFFPALCPSRRKVIVAHICRRGLGVDCDLGDSVSSTRQLEYFHVVACRVVEKNVANGGGARLVRLVVGHPAHGRVLEGLGCVDCI